jgi:hypothetical protein
MNTTTNNKEEGMIKFKLEKNDKYFKDVRWVLLARSQDKKECRTALRIVHSDGERITATDNFRLHQFDTKVIPAGNYQVLSSTNSAIILVPDDTDTRYPDVTNLWNDQAVEVCETTPDLDVSIARIIRKLDDTITINPYFIEDVIKADVDFTVSMVKENLRSAVQFKNGTHAALVMPKKIMD